MIFQLTVYSLLILILLALTMVRPAVNSPKRGKPAAVPFQDILGDALPIYPIFVAWALLMYLSGKPDLLPQYLAWALPILAIARAALQYGRKDRAGRVVGLLSVAILIFLWVQQLPIFGSAAV